MSWQLAVGSWQLAVGKTENCMLINLQLALVPDFIKFVTAHTK